MSNDEETQRAKLKQHGPYRLDRNRSLPVHTFVIRDKHNRHIADVNKYLGDREEFAHAIVDLLNREWAL